jgi:hypothetical protein
MSPRSQASDASVHFFRFDLSRSSITMSPTIAPTGSQPISPTPSAPRTNDPIAFTHNGHQYTATHEDDGGVSVRRDDGITMQFNAEQAADLQGLPTQNVLFGAPADAPDASFQGVPLDQVYNGDPTSSSPAPSEPLW